MFQRLRGPSGSRAAGSLEPEALVAAHRHSAHHREELQSSKSCGCFWCPGVFSASSISQWTDDGQTAVCPLCGVDSVLGSGSGHDLTPQFLREMKHHWFNG